jgi:hypothetical protein
MAYMLALAPMPYQIVKVSRGRIKIFNEGIPGVKDPTLNRVLGLLKMQ